MEKAPMRGQLLQGGLDTVDPLPREKSNLFHTYIDFPSYVYVSIVLL